MKKILIIEIVEDDIAISTALTDNLTKDGFEVIRAKDGEEGLAIALKDHPDLILLDIQLPGMDGYSVAVAIRNFDSLADTPMIAVTSYAMIGDREKSLASGCNGYIEKPINPDTFVKEISKLLK